MNFTIEKYTKKKPAKNMEWEVKRLILDEIRKTTGFKFGALLGMCSHWTREMLNDCLDAITHSTEPKIAFYAYRKKTKQ